MNYSKEEQYEKYKVYYNKEAKRAEEAGYEANVEMYSFTQFDLLYDAIKRDIPEAKKNPIRALVKRQIFYNSEKQVERYMEIMDIKGLSSYERKNMRYKGNVMMDAFREKLSREYWAFVNQGFSKEIAGNMIHDIYFPDSE